MILTQSVCASSAHPVGHIVSARVKYGVHHCCDAVLECVCGVFDGVICFEKMFV